MIKEKKDISADSRPAVSAAIYYDMFDLNPQPMWVYDLQTFRILEVNQAAIRNYGYSRSEFLALTIMDIRPEKDIPDLVKAVNEIRKSEKIFSRGIWKHRKKNGEIIDVEIQSGTIYVNGRKAELVLSLDVTAIVAAEREKQHWSEKLIDAQKIAKLGYWTRRLDEDISDWSVEMFEIYGRNPQTFVPTFENLINCFHPDDRYLLYEEAFTSLKEGEHNDFEHRIITESGEVKWVFQRIELQTDAEKQVIGIKGIIQDITEKRKADKKFKAVFDHTSDAILLGDDQGNCLDINEAATKMFGYSGQELNSLNLFYLFRNEQESEESGKRLLKENISNKIVKLLRKDGTHIMGNLNATLNIISGVHLYCVKDITDQMEKKKLLIQSERRFKALVQEGADLISILDSNGHYKFVGESYYHVLGLHPDELIGKDAFQYIHPEDRSRIAELFLKARHQKRTKTDPYRYLDAAGNYRWIVTTATNLSYDPAINGFVTNSRDITDTILKSNDLILSNERYKLIQKAANEAIYDWDMETGKVEWGPGFQDIFGFDLTIYSNKLWYDYIYTDDSKRVLTELKTAAENPDTEMLVSEFRFQKASGELALVEHRIIFLRNRQGLAIRAVGSLRDITDYRQNLLQIRLQNEKLKEIAWTQSHIVRAPLARLMGLVELLKIGACGDISQNEILNHILESAQELDVVIKDITQKADKLQSSNGGKGVKDNFD
ncbi:PAS domain S-box protein [Dyadobacter flavalbus]|uniref:histidine kinase n=1 Tax=Dyadobacter flavalbus TaxID=2579942 RepID=A0A5M8QG38_9BACT|nr:PAS domain S-box protein [Dyadobacter flavalbus]KAA6434101.1 PAS domain S-box protein [Dyadobacter flavalbus]